MTEIIGTAGFTAIPHAKCGKDIARVIGDVLHVECTRRGCREWVPLSDWVNLSDIQQVLALVASGQVSLADIMALADPLAPYRQIKGLFVVGPKELDELFRTETKINPFCLEPGWVPNVPIPKELDQWIRSCFWRDDKNWQTRAALVLVPPAISKVPTSLIGQNRLLGVPHDSIAAGIIRQDVFWSNYFVKEALDWAKEPATDYWWWLLVYEHPLFIARNNWREQQRIARSNKMPIATVAQDVWVLNMVRAVYSVNLRTSTWSRTSTTVDDCPLSVSSRADGVGVNRHWNPESAHDDLAASVQGVPGYFDS